MLVLRPQKHPTLTLEYQFDHPQQAWVLVDAAALLLARNNGPDVGAITGPKDAVEARARLKDLLPAGRRGSISRHSLEYATRRVIDIIDAACACNYVGRIGRKLAIWRGRTESPVKVAGLFEEFLSLCPKRLSLGEFKVLFEELEKPPAPWLPPITTQAQVNFLVDRIIGYVPEAYYAADGAACPAYTPETHDAVYMHLQRGRPTSAGFLQETVKLLLELVYTAKYFATDPAVPGRIASLIDMVLCLCPGGSFSLDGYPDGKVV